MKLVSFQSGKQTRLGVVKGDWVVDVSRMIRFLRRGRFPHAEGAVGVAENDLGTVTSTSPPDDMIQLLQLGTDWLDAFGRVLEAVVGNAEASQFPRGILRRAGGTRLVAPLARPNKIACVGLNYAAHAREQGREPPPRPVFFLKGNNTICGPGDPIVLPPDSNQIDYEAEFAAVIGKRAKQVPESEAYDYIAGYMILNDVTARDMQYSDRQWFRGKSCDTFGPTGPWIVTKDEVPDPHDLRISLTLNGETMQDSNTRDLIFKIPFLLSYLSQSMTWEVGDVLSTGTPGGVGQFRKPPVYLKPGDTVSITVEHIGTLTNPVQS